MGEGEKKRGAVRKYTQTQHSMSAPKIAEEAPFSNRERERFSRQVGERGERARENGPIV